MQDVQLLDASRRGPERAPVKALPVFILQVKQSGQNQEDYRTGHDAFFVHEGEQASRRNLATRSGNCTPKVNECAQRVKHVDAQANRGCTAVNEMSMSTLRLRLRLPDERGRKILSEPRWPERAKPR